MKSSKKTISIDSSRISCSLPMTHGVLTYQLHQFVGLISLVVIVSIIAISYPNVGATILLPKARICFNSMTNTFQSECVYCDSKQYTNTILACTGQPVLANNVTQAQAFCIATACLQVPVLLARRPSLWAPLWAKDKLLERTATRLNLFRSFFKSTQSPIAKLFALPPTMAAYDNDNNNNNNRDLKRAYYPQMMVTMMEPLVAQHRFKRDLFKPDHDDSGKLDDLIGNLSHSLAADKLAPEPNGYIGSNNNQRVAALMSTLHGEHNHAVANNATGGRGSNDTDVGAELPRAYADFNQMQALAQIQSGILPQYPAISGLRPTWPQSNEQQASYFHSAGHHWRQQPHGSIGSRVDYGNYPYQNYGYSSPQTYLYHRHHQHRGPMQQRHQGANSLAHLISATSDQLARKRQKLAYLLLANYLESQSRLEQWHALISGGGVAGSQATFRG